MRLTKRRTMWVCVVLLGVFASGCLIQSFGVSDRGGWPLEAAVEVERICLRRGEAPEACVTDLEKIGAIVNRMNAVLIRAERVVWYTPPASDRSIEVTYSDGAVEYVWVGEDWMQRTVEGVGYMSADLTEEEADRLLRMFDGAAGD